MSRTYEVEMSYKFTVPTIGEYDWQTYANRAYEIGLLSWDELDAGDDKAINAVMQAMAMDYAERNTGCTASTYVVSESMTAREV